MNFFRRLLSWFYNQPPTPTKNLQAKIKGAKMRTAEIEIMWTPSPDEDVVKQSLVVVTKEQNREAKPPVFMTLAPNVGSLKLKVREKTDVYIKLSAFDGTYWSKAMINSFFVGDLSRPHPPISNGWKILDQDDNLPCY
jgi:hypothetical protein